MNDDDKYDLAGNEDKYDLADNFEPLDPRDEKILGIFLKFLRFAVGVFIIAAIASGISSIKEVYGISFKKDSRDVKINGVTTTIKTSEERYMEMLDAKEALSNDDITTRKTRTAVVYYDSDGVTAVTSRIIADEINADLIRIVPYGVDDSGLHDYRPKIANEISLKKYDTIVLGYTVEETNYMPRIILTLLDSGELDYKIVLTFATDDNSFSFEQSHKALERQVRIRGSINLRKGRAFSTHATEKEIKAWIDVNR